MDLLSQDGDPKWQHAGGAFENMSSSSVCAVFPWLRSSPHCLLVLGPYVLRKGIKGGFL